ncbi:MAG TPA: DUF748 domain-containing protein [Verrucomicrobiae bacterium]|nr:DUF748 domain-containing protein [Verrucomicrobiae bacterium]
MKWIPRKKISRRRKAVVWILSLLLLYTIVGFLALPPIVRHVAVKQLSRQLGRDVVIEKVYLNPFTFSAAIRGLVIKEKDGAPFVSWDEVYVNFQPASVFRKAWTVKEISTTKPFVHVAVNADGSFNFSDILEKLSTNAAPAKPKTETKTPSKPLAALIELIRVNGANLQLENHLAFMNPSATNETANAVVVATNSVPPNILVLQLVTNAVAQLLDSAKQISGTIDEIEITNCAIHFQDFATARPAKLDLSDITLTAKNISNLPVTNLLANLSLRWNQNGSIKVATTVSLAPLTADVQFDLDKLDLGTLDPYLEPKLDLLILGSEINLHGALHVRSPENQLPQIAFSADTSVDGFHTVDGVMGDDLLKWSSVSVSGIDVNLNPESVAIKQIAVNDLYARAIVESNKTINLLNVLHITNSIASPTNQPKVAVTKTASTNSPGTNVPLPPITVSSIVISNAQISYTDRSIDPVVNMVIEQAGGTISGISSTELQHAVVDLHAIVDGIGPVAVTGTVNPFSGTLTNDITVSVKDVDLTPTSPYSGKFAGYRIAEGKLNLALHYELVGRKLNSENVITIDQFNFGEHVESPDATHLPVRLAIAMLKDRDGKIILDVPVQGSMDDPKFRIAKVVQRTLLNILEKVATSPFSLIGSMFGGGGEELGWQDFSPGGTALTADDMKKLDVLAKALYERPALQLEIAGSIDPSADREGLQRAALDKQIRTAIWTKMSKADRTNSINQIVLTPDDRELWIKKLYGEAVSDGKITPELIAANTNLETYAAQILPRKIEEKGATKLMKAQPKQTQAPTNFVYQTKLLPAPSPTEAVLLATIPVNDADFESLAAARTKSVEAYLLQTGKVDSSRLFLKQSAAQNLRRDGSRVYFEFR